MLCINSLRFWAMGNVTVDCVWHDGGGWPCRGVVPPIPSFSIAFFVPWWAPSWLLHDSPVAAHMFKLKKFVKASLLWVKCNTVAHSVPYSSPSSSVLWARSNLPVAISCTENYVFLRCMQLYEEECMCCICAGSSDDLSPESCLPDLLLTWEGTGALEISCFLSSSLPRCCTKCQSAFSSLILPPSFLCHFPALMPPWSTVSTLLHKYSTDYLGWWFPEEYAEMWYKAKSAALCWSQIMPEKLCSLWN